jgi:adenylosuccinate synthase
VKRPLICRHVGRARGRRAQANKNILFEAQLGTLRDLNFGIYPYTTSSCALAAYAPIGGGCSATVWTGWSRW